MLQYYKWYFYKIGHFYTLTNYKKCENYKGVNFVFKKGDAVVYPMHGAGIIEDLEEKNIDGVSCTYYVLRIPIGNLTILVSLDNVSSMRNILSAVDIERIIYDVSINEIINTNENWNQRYKDNMEKIKTGNLLQVVEVFHNLHRRESQKMLSTTEKKMLSTVKKIILSEIILSYDVEKTKAEEILSKILNNIKI